MENRYCVAWTCNQPERNNVGNGIVHGTERGVPQHTANAIANESNRKYKPLQYMVREVPQHA